MPKKIDRSPFPNTKFALLFCKKCKCPTDHVFERGVRAASGESWVHLIFTCQVCEDERIWGTALLDGETISALQVS